MKAQDVTVCGCTDYVLSEWGNICATSSCILSVFFFFLLYFHYILRRFVFLSCSLLLGGDIIPLKRHVVMLRVPVCDIYTRHSSPP